MKKRILFSVSAFMLITAFCLMSPNGALAGNNTVKQVAEQKTESVEKATLTVQGSCGMCKKKIESAAKGVKGVKSASYNLDKKSLIVEFDKNLTSKEAISKQIAQKGYDTNLDKAPDDIYNSLSGCCKYRK